MELSLNFDLFRNNLKDTEELPAVCEKIKRMAYEVSTGTGYLIENLVIPMCSGKTVYVEDLDMDGFDLDDITEASYFFLTEILSLSKKETLDKMYKSCRLIKPILKKINFL